VKVAIQLEDVQLFVVFKLVGSILGNLDYRTKDFGGAIADRQLQIIDHHFELLLKVELRG
jgi:hypothetical protein